MSQTHIIHLKIDISLILKLEIKIRLHCVQGGGWGINADPCRSPRVGAK